MTDFTWGYTRESQMETFTIHDVLINSTDLNKILCNFGFKNISECESEQEPSSEPKGSTVNLSILCCTEWCGTPCRIVHRFVQKWCCFYSKCTQFSPVLTKAVSALGIFCVSAHYAYGSGPVCMLMLTYVVTVHYFCVCQVNKYDIIHTMATGWRTEWPILWLRAKRVDATWEKLHSGLLWRFSKRIKIILHMQANIWLF